MKVAFFVVSTHSFFKACHCHSILFLGRVAVDQGCVIEHSAPDTPVDVGSEGSDAVQRAAVGREGTDDVFARSHHACAASEGKTGDSGQNKQGTFHQSLH